ncbi:MAG: hypothetical protein ACPGTO_02990 [Polaribacter sp.]
MREEHIKQLYKKYKLGETSLEEEEILFGNTEKIDLQFSELSTFVKKSKKEVPRNFNSKLWNSFEKEQQKKSRFKIGVLSGIAASLLLMIILYNNHSIKSDYQQKEVLLNEVKGMFETNEESTYRLIVENDLIAIYTKE